jgi:hypothetical protein
MLQWLSGWDRERAGAVTDASEHAEHVGLDSGVDAIALHLLDPTTFQIQGGRTQVVATEEVVMSLPGVIYWGQGPLAQTLVDVLLNDNAVHFLNHHRFATRAAFHTACAAIRTSCENLPNGTLLPPICTSHMYGNTSRGLDQIAQIGEDKWGFALPDGLVATRDDVEIDPRLHFRLDGMKLPCARLVPGIRR